jgi:hypothetical protein
VGELVCGSNRYRFAAALAAALMLLACGADSGGGAGPGPGDGAAPDASEDRTAELDLGRGQAAAPTDGAGSAPTDGAGPDLAAPVDGPVTPVGDPTAAIPVAPIA